MKYQRFFQILCLLLILGLGAGIAGCKASAGSQQGAGTAAPSTAATLGIADDGVFDNKDLFALMDEAEELLRQGKYTVQSDNLFVKAYFTKNSGISKTGITATGSAIVVELTRDAESNLEALRYGVFLDLVCSRYPDAICEADYSHTTGTNRPYMPYIFFCPGYKEAGFATALDCCKAIDWAEIKPMDNAFYLGYGSSPEILEFQLGNGVKIYGQK